MPRLKMRSRGLIEASGGLPKAQSREFNPGGWSRLHELGFMWLAQGTIKGVDRGFRGLTQGAMKGADRGFRALAQGAIKGADQGFRGVG